MSSDRFEGIAGLVRLRAACGRATNPRPPAPFSAPGRLHVCCICRIPELNEKRKEERRGGLANPPGKMHPIMTRIRIVDYDEFDGDATGTTPRLDTLDLVSLVPAGQYACHQSSLPSPRPLQTDHYLWPSSYFALVSISQIANKSAQSAPTVSCDNSRKLCFFCCTFPPTGGGIAA